MLFLAKSPFCLFHVGNEAKKSKKNTWEVFMQEKPPEPKGETRRATRAKIGCTLRGTGPNWPRNPRPLVESLCVTPYIRVIITKSRESL
jgi:hypothetical protein